MPRKLQSPKKENAVANSICPDLGDIVAGRLKVTDRGDFDAIFHRSKTGRNNFLVTSIVIVSIGWVGLDQILFKLTRTFHRYDLRARKIGKTCESKVETNRNQLQLS